MSDSTRTLFDKSWSPVNKFYPMLRSFILLEDKSLSFETKMNLISYNGRHSSILRYLFLPYSISFVRRLKRVRF